MSDFSHDSARYGLSDDARHMRVRMRSKADAALLMCQNRLSILILLFGFGFIGIAAKLAAIAVSSAADGTTVPGLVQTAHEPSVRADIVDRNGDLLATTLKTASLYADPEVIKGKNASPEQAAAHVDAAVDALVGVLPNLDAQTLTRNLMHHKNFVWVQRGLTPRQQQEILRLGLPGLGFEQELARFYPRGNLTAHALGVTGVDNEGRTGLELSLDERLRTNPAPLVSSLDMRIQNAVRRELADAMQEFRAIGAAGMVMDAHSGEILAMVSLPDFDPHNPPAPGSQEGARAKDLDPLFNRNSMGVYEMGSTFKIFNTAMALESGRVHMNDSFDATRPIQIGRFRISDFHPENRWMTVDEIFQHSSNIGSVRMAMEVGPAHQREFMAALGFLEPTKIELPERGRPQYPQAWRDINMMTISFGHGISVSPLHLMQATAAMINGGVMHPITLLKRDRTQPASGRRVISEATSDRIRQLMRLVVTDGTAAKADVPGYFVGGKTGTSEKNVNGAYVTNARISSFIGAFPMQDPRYVVFAMIDEPKGNAKTAGYATGGWVAAPAVGRIIAQIGPMLGVRPDAPHDPVILNALAVRPAPSATPRLNPAAQLAAYRPASPQASAGDDRD
jgi:cell division protein FtsI (penicillin-binding protein 3)